MHWNTESTDTDSYLQAGKKREGERKITEERMSTTLNTTVGTDVGQIEIVSFKEIVVYNQKQNT